MFSVYTVYGYMVLEYGSIIFFVWASFILDTSLDEVPSVFLIQPEIGAKDYIRQISNTCTYIVFTIICT
jgi:hypothetical protein